MTDKNNVLSESGAEDLILDLIVSAGMFCKNLMSCMLHERFSLPVHGECHLSIRGVLISDSDDSFDVYRKMKNSLSFLSPYWNGRKGHFEYLAVSRIKRNRALSSNFTLLSAIGCNLTGNWQKNKDNVEVWCHIMFNLCQEMNTYGKKSCGQNYSLNNITELLHLFKEDNRGGKNYNENLYYYDILIFWENFLSLLAANLSPGGLYYEKYKSSPLLNYTDFLYGRLIESEKEINQKNIDCFILSDLEKEQDEKKESNLLMPEQEDNERNADLLTLIAKSKF